MTHSPTVVCLQACQQGPSLGWLEAQHIPDDMHMHLYDSDEDEVRQVVGIEWKARARSVPDQHVLVTQVVTESANEDTLEPYYINDTIYQMVMEAPKPYNDGYKLLQKIE